MAVTEKQVELSERLADAMERIDRSMSSINWYDLPDRQKVEQVEALAKACDDDVATKIGDFMREVSRYDLSYDLAKKIKDVASAIGDLQFVEWEPPSEEDVELAERFAEAKQWEHYKQQAEKVQPARNYQDSRNNEDVIIDV